MSRTKNRLNPEREKSLRNERIKIAKWGDYLVKLSDDINEILETEDDETGKNWIW